MNRRNKIQYVEIDVSKQPDKIPDLLAFTNGERVTPVMVEDTTGMKTVKNGQQ